MHLFPNDRNLICISVIYCCFLTLLWFKPNAIQRAETFIIDYYFQFTSVKPPKNNPIVIVAIDHESLEQEGKWPWPKNTIARVINKVSEQKARTIAVSILLSDSEENVLKSAIRWFQKKKLNVPIILESLERYAKEDHYLANVLATSPTVTAYDMAKNEHVFSKQSYSKESLPAIINSAYQGIEAKDWSLMNVDQMHNIHSNAYEVQSGNVYSGFMHVNPDALARVREVPLILQYQGYFFPPLALVALQHWKGYAFLEAKVYPHHLAVHVAEDVVRTPSTGLLRILFYSNPQTFQFISAADVLSGKTSAQDFEGKLVLLGLTAQGVEPSYQTPYVDQMSFVEIQAHMIANVLNHQMLQDSEKQHVYELFLLTLIAFLYAFVSTLLVNRYFGMLSTSLFSFVLLMGYFSFQQYMVVDIVLPLLEVISCFILVASLNYTTELKQRLRLRNTFESFVDPAVVTDVIDHQQLTGLGGDEREMSVMFVDVAGFTSISEMLSPQETVRYINHFFQEATPVIFKHKGTIDRLTGDGLIVLFGAPIHDDEHAERACKTALDLQQALHKVRNVFRNIDCPLSIRVGINSGTMVVGNVGSKHRLHYTFMGDAGNTAARLESLNKQYGSQRMIGEATWKEVAHEFSCREIDTVILVGKKEAIKVYELLGDKASYDYWEPMIESYASALHLYRQGYFKEAAMIFRSGGERFEDLVAIRMAKRCDELSMHPALAWNGIWRTDRK